MTGKKGVALGEQPVRALSFPAYQTTRGDGTRAPFRQNSLQICKDTNIHAAPTRGPSGRPGQPSAGHTEKPGAVTQKRHGGAHVLQSQRALQTVSSHPTCGRGQLGAAPWFSLVPTTVAPASMAVTLRPVPAAHTALAKGGRRVSPGAAGHRKPSHTPSGQQSVICPSSFLACLHFCHLPAPSRNRSSSLEFPLTLTALGWAPTPRGPTGAPRHSAKGHGETADGGIRFPHCP